MREFERTTRRDGSVRFRTSTAAVRYRHYVLVCLAVLVVLAGGAWYASRISEGSPHVVYRLSLEQAAREAQKPLLVNINTATADELDELPEVGPATAQAIIEYRQGHGPFRSVEELEEVPGIGPATLEKIKPFATI
jgi:competence protein ComEA